MLKPVFAEVCTNAKSRSVANISALCKSKRNVTKTHKKHTKPQTSECNAVLFNLKCSKMDSMEKVYDTNTLVNVYVDLVVFTRIAGTS